MRRAAAVFALAAMALLLAVPACADGMGTSPPYPSLKETGRASGEYQMALQTGSAPPAAEAAAPASEEAKGPDVVPQGAAGDMLNQLDLAPLTDWSAREDAGVDVRALLSALLRGDAEWDLRAAGEAVKALMLSELRAALDTMRALLVPALIWAALSAASPPSSGAIDTMTLVCVLTVSAQLLALYERLLPVARGALTAIAALGELLYPLLAALLVAAGKAAGATMFTPTAAMAGGLITGAVARWVLPMIGVVAALTIAGSLSARISLSALTSLMRKGVTLSLSVGLTLFTAMLSAQGLLSKSYDGASIEAARFAAGSLVPVIGGELADSLDVVVSSAHLLRSALGVTGILLLVGALARPLVVIAMHALAVRLAAALAEPLAAGPVQQLIERFAGVLSLLLAAVVAGAVLIVALIGASLTVFGG